MNQGEFETGLRADGFGEIAEAAVPPDTLRAEHTHPFEVRALMLDGVLHLTRDGVETPYKPGDVFVMPPGYEHIERTTSEGARYLVGRKHA
jgi:quercetin dioxygenase-like cupin family protein